MRILSKFRQGFSLIELLLIMAILGILFSITLIAINPARIIVNTRDTKRSSDLKEIQLALEAYKSTHATYPLSTSDFKITGAFWNSSWSGYLESVPQDPTQGASYAYVSDGTSFKLYANFEGTEWNQKFACPSACGPSSAYNGGVTSGNTTLP